VSQVAEVPHGDRADALGGWEYSLRTRKVRVLSREEVERNARRPTVPVAWGVEAEPGWQRDIALASLAAAAVGAAAWRASGTRRIALGIVAGVLALPLLSLGVILGLARAVGRLEGETKVADP
jgi:hypothetical protein